MNISSVYNYKQGIKTMSIETSKKSKQAYLEKHPDRVKESCKKYYEKNKTNLLKKKRDNYKLKRENSVKEIHETTRNYRILKEKLGDISEWKQCTEHDFSDKNLLNKITGDICLHCLCGHRVGKLEKNDVQPIELESHIDENPEITKICKGVFQDHKRDIETKAKNSITTYYDECSLLPMVRENCNDYILIGKKCARYFNLTDDEIKDAFKSKRQKDKQNARDEKKMKRKMSEDPKILLQDYEMIDRGKYKGMSIYKINTLKRGPEYLEFITRWSNISQQTIDAIEDLLLYSI